MEDKSGAGAVAGAERFRVLVSLERYFGADDERARVYMCAEGARPVRWLARRLRQALHLPPPLALLSRGHLLPPREPLGALLRPDDPVLVIPASSGECCSRSPCHSSASSSPEREPAPAPAPGPDARVGEEDAPDGSLELHAVKKRALELLEAVEGGAGGPRRRRRVRRRRGPRQHSPSPPAPPPSAPAPYSDEELVRNAEASGRAPRLVRPLA